MTLIAQGIFSKNIDWDYMFIGVGLGLLIILFDVLLKHFSHSRLSLPALAVGLGIYLPPSVSSPLFIGAVVFWLLRRYLQKQQNSNARIQQFTQKSTLFAAGLIVGESLIGVILAMTIVVSTTSGGSDAPLALNLGQEHIAKWLGLIVFIISILIFARRSIRFKPF